MSMMYAIWFVALTFAFLLLLGWQKATGAALERFHDEVVALRGQLQFLNDEADHYVDRWNRLNKQVEALATSHGEFVVSTDARMIDIEDSLGDLEAMVNGYGACVREHDRQLEALEGDQDGSVGTMPPLVQEWFKCPECKIEGPKGVWLHRAVSPASYGLACPECTILDNVTFVTPALPPGVNL